MPWVCQIYHDPLIVRTIFATLNPSSMIELHPNQTVPKQYCARQPAPWFCLWTLWIADWCNIAISPRFTWQTMGNPNSKAPQASEPLTLTRFKMPSHSRSKVISRGTSELLENPSWLRDLKQLHQQRPTDHQSPDKEGQKIRDHEKLTNNKTN